MKINKSKKLSIQKKVVIAAAVVALVAGAVAGLVFRPQTSDETPAQDNSADNESLQQKSDDYTSPKDQAASAQPDSTPAEPEGDKSSVAVVITSPPVQSIDSFRVRAYIQHPTTQGVCTLTLSASGKNDIVKQTIGLQPNNQISGCQDIVIPASELSVGTWSATLSYDSDSYKGAVTQSIKVE